MKFRDLKEKAEDWWDDATEETKLFVGAAAIFVAGLVVGAWVL